MAAAVETKGVGGTEENQDYVEVQVLTSLRQGNYCRIVLRTDGERALVAFAERIQQKRLASTEL